jgi:hypothetical protein
VSFAAEVDTLPEVMVQDLDRAVGNNARHDEPAPISLADLRRMPSNHGEGCQEAYGNRSPSGESGYGGGEYNTYSRSRGKNSSPQHAGSAHMGGSLTSPHTGVAPLPLGPDGLPTHRHDGLPTFNSAFPNYFSALSGPTKYYNQFRIPDREYNH